jgi:membrane protein DedA with SNARE-associated domain
MSEGCDVDNLVRSTIAFVQDHQAWGAPIVFVLAFCESFAFVSLLVPATGILLGVGGLIAAAELGFWPMWFAAALGAIVGDWLAYWLAFHFKDRVLQTWPLAGNPDLVARGVGFFKKWGMLAVFVGRFFGPFRAVVPLIAGLNAMPWLNFSNRQRCIGGRLGRRDFAARLHRRPLADGMSRGSGAASRLHRGRALSL